MFRVQVSLLYPEDLAEVNHDRWIIRLDFKSALQCVFCSIPLAHVQKSCTQQQLSVKEFGIREDRFLEMRNSLRIVLLRQQRSAIQVYLSSCRWNASIKYIIQQCSPVRIL